LARTSILPVAGWGEIAHMLIPAIVLGLGTMAFLVRLMRSSMLEVVNTDYIRTAKAKGLSPVRIFFVHQLRNAVMPVITVLGPAIAAITTGGFVVELVFAIPGLGRYFVEAVQQMDYTVIMGTTVFYGAFLVLMVIVVDIAYAFVDPRIRLR
jgi:ABC-type dipeptide/oligopeptide/nickel transport system permease component